LALVAALIFRRRFLPFFPVADFPAMSFIAP